MRRFSYKTNQNKSKINKKIHENQNLPHTDTRPSEARRAEDNSWAQQEHMRNSSSYEFQD
jgi:hypothetical protein